MDDSLSIQSISTKQQNFHPLKKMSLQSFQKSKQNLIGDDKDDEHILSNNNISFIPLVKENSFLIGNNEEYSELNSHRQNIVTRQDEQFEFKTDNLDFVTQPVFLQNQKENNLQEQPDIILKDLESIKNPKENNFMQNEPTTNKNESSQPNMNNSYTFSKKYDNILEHGDYQDVEDEQSTQNGQQKQFYHEKKAVKKRKRHEIPTEANFEDITRLDFDMHPSVPSTQNEKNNKLEIDEEQQLNQAWKQFDYNMFKRQRQILSLITMKNLKQQNHTIKKFVDFSLSLLPFDIGKVQLEGNINLLSDFMKKVIVPYLLILNHNEANRLLPIMDRLDKSKYLQFCYNKNINLRQYENVVKGHILIRMCRELSWRIQLFNTIAIIMHIILLAYRVITLAFRFDDFQEIKDGNLKYPNTGLDKISFSNQILFLVAILPTLAFYIKGLLFYIKRYFNISMILFIISLVFNITAFCLAMALFQKPRPINQQLTVWAERHQIILFCLNLVSIFFSLFCTSYTLLYCKRIECFLQIEQTSKLIDL